MPENLHSAFQQFPNHQRIEHLIIQLRHQNNNLESFGFNKSYDHTGFVHLFQSHKPMKSYILIFIVLCSVRDLSKLHRTGKQLTLAWTWKT